MDDTEILNALEKWHTLHYTVEVLYVVDGYEAQLMHDGNLKSGPFKGETLRETYTSLFTHLQWNKIK